MGRGFSSWRWKVEVSSSFILIPFPDSSVNNKQICFTFPTHHSLSRPTILFYFIYLFRCRTHNPRGGVVVLAIIAFSPPTCVFFTIIVIIVSFRGAGRVNVSVADGPGFWPCQIAVNISNQFQFNNVKVFLHLLTHFSTRIGFTPETVVNRGGADKLGICCTQNFFVLVN